MRRAAAPPRDDDAAGTDVFDHMRRLEARSAPGLTAHVIPIFLHDTAERLVTLRAAVIRRDANAAHRVAHTLHGSAATVGAVSMVRSCADILQAVRAESFGRCEALMTDLDTDLESIRRMALAQGVL
jgi:HPt (histidine-containing phosphotransfer) domain-containing protein